MLLDSKGVTYKEIAVDFGGEEKQAMIERAKGRTTVPQIFINHWHVGGCDDLVALDRDGKLDKLIGP
jgi:glutaredoxin 3